jgi:hypothetical protein
VVIEVHSVVVVHCNICMVFFILYIQHTQQYINQHTCNNYCMLFFACLGHPSRAFNVHQWEPNSWHWKEKAAASALLAVG